MNAILFSKSNPMVTDHACPACGTKTARHMLEVDAKGFALGKLELVECSNCKTAFFLGEDPVIGYDHKGFEENYWDNRDLSG